MRARLAQILARLARRLGGGSIMYASEGIFIRGTADMRGALVIEGNTIDYAR